LKALLAANKRLNTAYVLKESFGQLWSYEREGWARRFFENWRASSGSGSSHTRSSPR
jgi:transposase